MRRSPSGKAVELLGLVSVALGVLLLLGPIRIGAQRPAEWNELIKGTREIEEQEKDVLGALFLLRRSANYAEIRLQALQHEAAQTRTELAHAELELSRAERQYLQGRDRAAKLLRLIQQMGPASYVEVLAGASSWNDFLERLNLVVSVARNVTKGLDNLIRSRTELAERRRALQKELNELDVLIKEIKTESRRRNDSIRAIERLLAGLGEQRETYRRKLEELERSWIELSRPFANQITRLFTALPERIFLLRGVTVEPSGKGWRMVAPQSSLSNLMEGTGFPAISLELKGGKVRFTSPDSLISVIGRLEIENGTRVKYVIEGIEFSHIPLHAESVVELFGSDHILADMTLLPGDHLIDSLTVSDGELELVIVGR